MRRLSGYQKSKPWDLGSEICRTLTHQYIPHYTVCTSCSILAQATSAKTDHAATSVRSMVTSYGTARTSHTGCKVENTPLLVHFCPSDSCLVAPLYVHFLFPSSFAYDALARASLAQTLLVSDCTAYRDYPLHCFLSDTLFLYEDTPHHLIILLPSCILRVCPMTSFLLTHFTFRISHTIQPP